MLLLEKPIVIALLAAAIALHIAAEATPRIISKILAYVNIALHICLIIPLAFYKFSIEESVLIYMISLAVYTVSAAVGLKLRGRAGATHEAEAESGDAAEPLPTGVGAEDALNNADAADGGAAEEEGRV